VRPGTHEEKLFLKVQRHVEVLAGGEEIDVDGRRMLEGQCWGRTSLGYIINYSDAPSGAIGRAQSSCAWAEGLAICVSVRYGGENLVCFIVIIRNV
jgi:hypothetical protein